MNKTQTITTKSNINSTHNTTKSIHNTTNSNHNNINSNHNNIKNIEESKGNQLQNVLVELKIENVSSKLN